MCDGRKGSSASATGVGKRRPEAQAIAFEKRMIPSIPTAEEREAGGALEHAGTPIRRSPPSSPHRRDPHRADTAHPPLGHLQGGTDVLDAGAASRGAQ